MTDKENATPAEMGESKEQSQENTVTTQDASGKKADATVTEDAVNEQETQDQNDPAWLKKRLERERRKLERKLKEQYGDYDQLKKAAEELQKIKDAQKTEQERLQEQLAKTQARLAELEQQATERAIQMAVMQAAQKAGMIRPELAYRLVDLTALTVTEDGTVEGAEEAIEEVLEMMPELRKKKVPTVTAVNPSQAANPPSKTDEDRMREYFGNSPSSFWNGSGVRIVKGTLS